MKAVRSGKGYILASDKDNPLVRITPLSAEGGLEIDGLVTLLKAAPQLLAALKSAYPHIAADTASEKIALGLTIEAAIQKAEAR